MERTIAALFENTLETTAGTMKVRELLDTERPTVFISYPMDFTSTCTKQLCDYRENWGAFAKLPVKWWGINQVRVEKHEKFKERYQLPFDLITDKSGELVEALGLKSLLWVKRGFAVVSPGGQIVASWAGNPFRYPKPSDVMTVLEPMVAGK